MITNILHFLHREIFFLSFLRHSNVAGNGKQWMNARGWTCYTSRGQTAGDHLADCLYRAAALWLPGHKLRKDYSDGDPDWESDFYILKNTLYGAVPTENLFHDNSDDCLFLESDDQCGNVKNFWEYFDISEKIITFVP